MTVARAFIAFPRAGGLVQVLVFLHVVGVLLGGGGGVLKANAVKTYLHLNLKSCKMVDVARDEIQIAH